VGENQYLWNHGQGYGTIVNSYAVGTVSGSSNIGGLVGLQSYIYANSGGVTSSYYNVETSGRTDENKGTPKLTTEMGQQATYIGWDFTANTGVWIMKEYPYLQWEKNTTVYTVAFNANDGVVNPTSMSNLRHGSVIALPTPTRNEYIFNGWFNAASGGTRYGDAEQNYTVTENLTMIAQWIPVHTVTFNANGGTVTPTSSTTNASSTLTIPLPIPTRIGYTFNGWFTNIIGGTKVTESTVFSANIIIHAQWTFIKIVPVAANLIYNLPIIVDYDGTTKAVSVTAVNDLIGFGNITVKYNGSTTVPINAGTYTISVSITEGDNYLATEMDISLGDLTITKATGFGTVSIDGWIQGQSANTPVSASATNGTTNVTYHYKFQDANDATYTETIPTVAGNYTVRTTFAATENYLECTATANFTIIPTYTITFNSAGGSDVDEQTISEGGLATKPTDPTKDGFTFLGWVKDVLDSFWNFLSDIVTSNMTLTAIWEAISSSSTEQSSSSVEESSSSSFEDVQSSSSNNETPIHSLQLATSNQVTQIYNGINLQAKSNAVIEIFSLKGDLIWRQNFSGGVYTVSLGHLPKGVYIVKTSFGSEKKILRVPVR
jgi:uncharacterized repeat protein (TIGR02543 family)